MKIVITGASGLVGRSLMQHLLNAGHTVYALVRTPSKISEIKSENVFAWKHTELPNLNSLKGMDAVVHLIGESVADKRWSEQRKRDLRDSRVISTRNLVDGIGRLPVEDRPKFLISTSGTGFYGDTGETLVNESSPNGNDFLAGICRDWENEAAKVSSHQVRLAIMRLGLVLSPNGGFLGKMAPVVLGSGKQWMSWIHIHDLLMFIQRACENNKMQGTYNLVSPEPIRNHDLTKVFAKVKGFPVTISAPTFALKLALGEMAEAVLASQRVEPKHLRESGFQYQFSSLEKALLDIYSPKRTDV